MIRSTILITILSAFSMLSFAQHDPANKLMQEYRYKEAIEWLDDQPETIENLLLKAESYEKLYDYHAAIPVYEKVLALDTTQLSIIIAFAESNYQAGDSDKSFTYWT